MNIWRVKSKYGKTIHLTYDREKTLCGRTIGDDWQFIYLLNDKTEALEHVEDLCEKCNDVNLEEWEKEMEDDRREPESSTIHGGGHTESNEEEPAVSVRSVRPKGLGTWES